MGMEALAYLWYGTKTQSRFEGYETLNYSERRAFGESLARRGVKVVCVQNDGFQYFALATLASYHQHNWTSDAKRIEALPNPSAYELAVLRAVAIEIHWPFDEAEFGWYMGATIWV